MEKRMLICDNHNTDPVVTVNGLNLCRETRAVNNVRSMWRRNPRMMRTVAEII